MVGFLAPRFGCRRSANRKTIKVVRKAGPQIASYSGNTVSRWVSWRNGMDSYGLIEKINELGYNKPLSARQAPGQGEAR